MRFSPRTPLLLVAVLALLTVACATSVDPTSEPKTLQWSAAPSMTIDTSKTYNATLVTEIGDIVLELAADKVPIIVNNFVFLAREGYYDNITFHRVIPDFMVQGGDRTGSGTGGPGYTIPDEFHPDLRHDSAGVISTANVGLPDTNGSQFFITLAPTPRLDGLNPDDSAKDCANPRVSCHSVFGRVTQGMDVLRSIRIRDPQTDRNPGTRLVTVRIVEE
jgi:cyclophilin family peptidyl-prolyl cis-trans isomerase